MLRWLGLALTIGVGVPDAAWANACDTAYASSGITVNCEGKGWAYELFPSSANRIGSYPACDLINPQNGPEILYKFTCAQSNHVRLELSSQTCDVDMYVLGASCNDPGATCYGQNIDDWATLGTTSNLEMECVAGTTYFIALEANALANNPGQCLHQNASGQWVTSAAFVLRPKCDEICDDGFDNDRDNLKDCADPDCANTTVCCDADRDGAFRSAAPTCTGNDCNDANGTIYPGAPERVGDGVDQDCDGVESCYLDEDLDHFGTSPAVPVTDLDCLDPYEADVAGDCDDGNDLVYPGALEVVADQVDQSCDGREVCYADADGDRYGKDAATTVVSTDPDCADAGEATVVGDCAPLDAGVHPGATEAVADFVDQDCDGRDACWQDLDGDLWGTSLVVRGNDLDCAGPLGEAAVSGDCNDADARAFPGNPEVPYDGVDQDCSGADLSDVDQDGYAGGTGPDCDDHDAARHPGATDLVADGIDQDCDGGDRCWTDADRDLWGAAPSLASADLDCTDAGEASVLGDCDDATSLRNPAMVEIVGDGVDEDCDGGERCWFDGDGDGFGVDSVVPSADADCLDAGEASVPGDCDDGRAAIRPGVPEVVGDGVDQDCDGVDTCYRDADLDGYGGGGTVRGVDLSCAAHAGTATRTGDCDDTRSDAFPGGVEVPYDGVDQDCSGADLSDIDQDGFAGGTGPDCNDRDASVKPGAVERVADGIDQDCDGGDRCWGDADRDRWGVAPSVASANLACTDPGEAVVLGDCDDTAAARNPGATEVVGDGIDEDCDGGEWCWLDADVDGWGVGTPIASTDADCGDAGEASVAGDCDDGRAAIRPGATEVVGDGVDQDCDAVDTCFRDGDGDGYGGPLTVVGADLRCAAHAGTAAVDGDCDDARADTFPGGVEVPYDGVDQDCTGADLVDVDVDGATGGPLGTDCNDRAATVAPGASERANGVDDDCDGAVDEGTRWGDDDRDGVTEDGGDCDDGDAARRPGAAEAANGVDDDCDGATDEGTAAHDDDGDGWCEGPVCTDGATPGDCHDGDARFHPGVTEPPGAGADRDCDGRFSGDDTDHDGYAQVGGDCDEGDATRHPGAPETLDGRDEDCDGVIDDGTLAGDDDGDGACEVAPCADPTDVGGDCDDGDVQVGPGVAESPANGRDDDCDGTVDEGGRHVDDDGDGFTEDGGDCDDTDATRSPRAVERLDGVDQDCDGTVDDGARDLDGDGWAIDQGDCDDGNGWANPERTESCDDVDNDCDGEIDEGCVDLPPVDTGTPDDDKKGCDTGGPGPLAWAPLLALAARRRRRAG